MGVSLALAFTLSCSGGDDDGISVTSGNFKDNRDSKSYKWVKIGTQTWMAENLNYNTNTSGSVCYGDQESSCATYGRLYNWATAMTACPSGWHLPSDAEWTTLTDYVGGASTAGTKLKATSGWNSYSGTPVGTDNYGFSALPGGNGSSSDDFSGVGEDGSWWSTAEDDSDYAYYRGIGYNYEAAYWYFNYKHYMLSVRCLQD